MALRQRKQKETTQGRGDLGRYNVAVLHKALDVLELVADRPGLRLQELADYSGMPKTTLFRLAVTLEERGYLARPNGGIQLGWRSLRFGESSRKLLSQLEQNARVHLEVLRDAFGDTVNLAVRQGNRLVYLVVAEGTNPLRFVEPPGTLGPLHATALGKVLLAWLPTEQVRELLPQSLERRTSHTLTSISEVLRELELTKRRGYAIDDEESVVGAFCIATPVLRTGHAAPDAAISITGLKAQMGEKRRSKSVRLLVEAASRVAKGL